VFPRLDSAIGRDEEMSCMSTFATERTMRALCIVAPRKLVVEEVPIASPAPGQVRIRVRGTGVCASNLGPWLGLPWLKYPLAPGEGGHEAWGTVDAVGEGVRDLEVGDAVAAVSYRAYADYDVADAKGVVKIPKALVSGPFPGEALGCAMNIFRRARIQRGQVVAIVGIGFLGSILTRLAASAGAKVIAISRRDCSLKMARTMGASEIVPMLERSAVVDAVRTLTADALCDRVIEATGVQSGLDLASELTRTHGTLVIAGYHQDGPRQVNVQLWNWRGIDVVNAHERRIETYSEGIQEAARAVEMGALDPAPLYTDQFPLERLGEALDATAERPRGFFKALVVP
jgi:threonine dehydrogenase-like Zn-dependent dehydrogenase